MASRTRIQPIEWPQWYVSSGPNPKRHFLEGMPFIGPHARILREARSVLEKRDPCDVNKCWKAYDKEVPVVVERGKVFEVVNRYVRWPHQRFVPMDRAPIAFGFIPGIWFDTEDVISDIVKKLKIDKSAVNHLYLSADEDTLLGFFECLNESWGDRGQ